MGKLTCDYAIGLLVPCGKPASFELTYSFRVWSRARPVRYCTYHAALVSRNRTWPWPGMKIRGLNYDGGEIELRGCSEGGAALHGEGSGLRPVHPSDRDHDPGLNDGDDVSSPGQQESRGGEGEGVAPWTDPGPLPAGPPGPEDPD